MVALAVRIVSALISARGAGYLIPDEQQYIEVAGMVARGHPASAWHPTYGEFLYSSTWVYTGVLRFLFEIFGQSEVVASLYPAVVGAIVAVLTAVLARRFVSSGFAALAGLFVALMPSQILWSSVALREAFVWCGLVGLAVLCALAIERSRHELIPIAIGIALAFVGLNHLRNQTLIAAIWSVMLAGLFGSRNRWHRASGALGLGVVVPILLGLGAAGFSYVDYGMTGIVQRRTVLALDADSAVVDLRPYSSSTTLADESNGQGSDGQGSDGQGRPSNGQGGDGQAMEGQGSNATPTPTIDYGTPTTLPSGERIVGLRGGPAYIVDEGARQTISHLPDGFLAFAFRPLPWESTSKIGITLARFENLAWFALYGLALAGAIRARNNPALAFPFFCVMFITGIASLSQGNIGTAFRHRGQLLWAFAAIAVVPLERWWLRRAGDDRLGDIAVSAPPAQADMGGGQRVHVGVRPMSTD